MINGFLNNIPKIIPTAVFGDKKQHGIYLVKILFMLIKGKVTRL